MNHAPKVTVLGTCYNHERYIYDAVSSVLRQTFTDFELIFFDDASSDNSVKILRRFNDPRIKIFANDQNMGVCRTLNAAMPLIRGEYLSFIDGDDIIHQDKLKLQVEYLDAHPEMLAVFSNMLTINEHGEITRDKAKRTKFINKITSRHLLLRELFLGKNHSLYSPTEMLRTSVLPALGYLYDIRCEKTHDSEQHVRVLLQGAVGMLEYPLVQYRDHAHNASRGSGRIVATENNFALEHFLHTKDVDLVESMFPECVYFGKVTVETIPYFLARIAIASAEPRLILWGLDVLGRLMNSEDAAACLEAQVNFSLKDYYEIKRDNCLFER